jgi:8-hydroxy-5-deazaflavin:NADPH oxidoreductase
MTTAIIGVGNIGGALARDLVRAGERVVLAARDESHAEAVPKDLGDLATPASVRDAIAAGDVVVLAIWLDQSKKLVPTIADLLAGKVVVDPSNPIGFDDDGKPVRTLPDGVSAGSVVAGLVPAGARCVKAFGRSALSHSPPRSIVLLGASSLCDRRRGCPGGCRTPDPRRRL